MMPIYAYCEIINAKKNLINIIGSFNLLKIGSRFMSLKAQNANLQHIIAYQQWLMTAAEILSVNV